MKRTQQLGRGARNTKCHGIIKHLQRRADRREAKRRLKDQQQNDLPRIERRRYWGWDD